MWFKKILSSLVDIRKSKDLEDNLNNLTITRVIILFIIL